MIHFQVTTFTHLIISTAFFKTVNFLVLVSPAIWPSQNAFTSSSSSSLASHSSPSYSSSSDDDDDDEIVFAAAI